MPTSRDSIPNVHQWPWQYASEPHPLIHIVPAFDDNYLWLVTDAAQKNAIVVDPGDAAPVRAALAEHQLTLTGILITHHHGDHIGGLAELANEWKCPVYGPAADSKRIAGLTKSFNDGDLVEFEKPAIRFKAITVPGHTTGHMAYFAEQIGDDPRGVLFCGDTLFAAGCGRMFEGTPTQMSQSLRRLASLPGSSLVYCAHEYTLANLRFARVAEPDSVIVAARISEAQQMRDEQIPTVPTSIAIERTSNPFLRTKHAAVQQAAASHSGHPYSNMVATFADLRRWKDGF